MPIADDIMKLVEDLRHVAHRTASIRDTQQLRDSTQNAKAALGRGLSVRGGSPLLGVGCRVSDHGVRSAGAPATIS